METKHTPLEIKKEFPTQIGRSITCDFYDSTWTLLMPKDFAFTGGEFAIIPKQKYDQLINNHERLVEMVEKLQYSLMINGTKSNYNFDLVQQAAQLLTDLKK